MKVERGPGSAGGSFRQKHWTATGHVLLVATAFGLLMFLCSVALDWVLLRHHEGAIFTIVVSDALAGLIAGVLLVRLLQIEHERRARVEERLETISDMNHHIRNALQVISYSVNSSRDQQQLAEINEALDRIQWALREVLPRVEPTFESFEGRARGLLPRAQIPKK